MTAQCQQVGSLSPCPRCCGSGKMAYTVHSPGQAVQSLSMPCIFCDATGKITEQRRSALRAEAALWCRCEDNEAGTQYVADGAGIIAKHHWVCLHCGKIVQIG